MKTKRRILFVLGILFISIILIWLLSISAKFSNPLAFRLKGSAAEKLLSRLKWNYIDGKKINENLLAVYQKPTNKPDPVELCEKISFGNDKYTCLALVNKDELICDKISETYARDRCYKSTFEAKGVSSSSVCEKLESAFSKEKCFDELGVKMLDPLLCEKAKSICEEEVQSGRTDTVCIADGCLSEVAQAKKDITICEKIDDKYYKNVSCYIGIAEETRDYSACGKIEKDLDVGLNAPPGTTGSDVINICNQRVKNAIAKNKAKSENNISYCKEIKSVNEGWDISEDCYYEIATDKKDISVCKKITNESKQAECIAVINNPHACARVADGGCCSTLSFRQSCFNKAAISLEDPAFCGAAGLDDSKDDCYFSIALKLANIQIKSR